MVPLFVVVTVAAASAAFWYVQRFGVNVPFLDQWDAALVFYEREAGTLSVGDLFSQNGENRMFFPRLAVMALAPLTDYNTTAEAYVLLVGILFNLGILFAAMKVTMKRTSIAIVVIPAMLFSLRQYENMLPGIQVLVLFFALTFGLLALLLLLLSRRPRFGALAFAGALVCGTLACFSAIPGLYVWVAGFLQLILVRGRNFRVFLPIWCLVGAVEWFLYLHGLKRIKSHPSLSFVIENPWPALEYFLTVMGAALIPDEELALASGILFSVAALGALALTIWNRKLRESSYWVSLASLGLLVIGSITVGRSALGLEQAFSSRYATLSMLFLVSILMLLIKLHVDGGRGAAVAGTGVFALCAWVVLCLPATYIDSIRIGEELKLQRQKIAFAVLTARSQPDEMLFVGRYPDPVAVKNFGGREIMRGTAHLIRVLLAPTLERLEYSVFAPSERARFLPPAFSTLARADARSTCVVEKINDTTVYGQPPPVVIEPVSTVLSVSGWCVDDRAQGAAGGVYLELDGRLYPALYGLERPDLARGFGSEAYRFTGWDRFILLPKMKSRTHRLSVFALSADRKRYYEPRPQLKIFRGFELPGSSAGEAPAQ